MTYPHDIVTEESKKLLAQGITVLQGNRLAPTQEEHLARLAGYMRPFSDELVVADMGCGFGEVSRFLSEMGLAVYFCLVNQNKFQLAQCPKGPAFRRLEEDMCDTSIPDGIIDLVMFNYSICHVDPLAALLEAQRIAARRGRIFIYDYERVSGDDELTVKYLAGRFLTDKKFKVLCSVTGWRGIETLRVDGDDTLFRQAANNDAVYDAMFEHLAPVIWRAHR